MEGELVVSLVDLVRDFQQVLERRKEVPKFELQHDSVHRRADDGAAAAAADRRRRSGVAGGVFRGVPDAQRDDLALLAVLEMVRHAGDHAGAEGDFRGYLAAKAQDVRRGVSRGAGCDGRKSRSNICSASARQLANQRTSNVNDQ